MPCGAHAGLHSLAALYACCMCAWAPPRAQHTRATCYTIQTATKQPVGTLLLPFSDRPDPFSASSHAVAMLSSYLSLLRPCRLLATPAALPVRRAALACCRCSASACCRCVAPSGGGGRGQPSTLPALQAGRMQAWAGESCSSVACEQGKPTSPACQAYKGQPTTPITPART